MKKLLVITVGTTLDPIIESIEKNNDTNAVYLVYGRSLSLAQQPNPFDVAYEAKQRAEEIGKLVKPVEIEDPEDIDSCISAFRKLAKDTYEFNEVIVNFTGGTKPMSAAAFHVFMADAPSKVIFEYVGGKIRNKNGRVVEMEVRRSYETLPAELSGRIIYYIEDCQFYLAKKISESLPDRVYRFLKKASEAFWLWDSFEYEKATRIFNEIGKTAENLAREEFGRVPENVVKLRNIGNMVVDALKRMRRYQNKENVNVDGCYILSLDAIANAERRLKTHNYIESVLRAYRAVEVATQVKLLENKINPWDVDWSSIENNEELLKELGYKDYERAPKQLTLWNGLRVLDFIDSSDIYSKIENDLKFISQTRNHSKLEHGYSDVDRNNAEKAVNKALGIIKTIIGVEDFSYIDSLRIFN